MSKLKVVGIKHISIDPKEITVICATDVGVDITLQHPRAELPTPLAATLAAFVAVYDDYMRKLEPDDIDHTASLDDPNVRGFIEYMTSSPEEEVAIDRGPVTRVYRGWLHERDDEYGGDDILILQPTRNSPDAEPIADLVYDDLTGISQEWSVCYWTANREMSGDELQEAFLCRAFGGEGTAEYWEGSTGYSEWTPGSTTHQELKVGGHDLLEELRTHVGKFLHLEITFA